MTVLSSDDIDLVNHGDWLLLKEPDHVVIISPRGTTHEDPDVEWVWVKLTKDDLFALVSLIEAHTTYVRDQLSRLTSQASPDSRLIPHRTMFLGHVGEVEGVRWCLDDYNEVLRNHLLSPGPSLTSIVRTDTIRMTLQGGQWDFHNHNGIETDPPRTINVHDVGVYWELPIRHTEIVVNTAMISILQIEWLIHNWERLNDSNSDKLAKEIEAAWPKVR